MRARVEDDDTEGKKSRGPGARFLSILGDVRRGEAGTTSLLALNIFLLLFAYYLLKVTREPLILRHGADFKTYASSFQALTLMPALIGFAWVSQHVPRVKLVGITTFIIASLLVVFYVLVRTDSDIAGPAFYVFVGVMNAFVVSQFWAFANDLFSEEQGIRLFGIIGVGSSVGALLGPLAAKAFFNENDPGFLMLPAACLIALAFVVTLVAHKRAGAAHISEGRVTEEPLAKERFFGLGRILSSRYFGAIALLVLVYNTVNTLGENIKDRTLLAANHGGHQDAYVASFSSNFFLYVNATALILQLFFVSRFLRVLKVHRALYVMPLISLVSYSSMGLSVILPVVLWAKVAENAADYSIQSTTRQALFLVAERSAKYKVKAAIDTFFMRLGDVFAAALLFVTTTYMHFDRTGLVIMNLVLVGLWLFLARRIGRDYQTMSHPTQP